MRLRRRTRRALWVLAAVASALLFVTLRLLHWAAPEPGTTRIFTDHVVVVGVEGRYALSETDSDVLGVHLNDAQAGSMSVRPRYVGDCAAAGWTTLGAGRRAAVGGLCTPAVEDGRVVDWDARRAAAAANRGDAHLGTLAAAVPGCVAAVGAGAALAAARPDGTVAAYATVDELAARGYQLGCPITLVDAGARSDQVIGALADRDDLTLIVTGIGPVSGSDEAGLQVVYRLGTTLPGWLTSASTRREGIVTLTDLTATLVEFGQGSTPSSAAIDGSPFAVYEADLSVPGIEAHLAAVSALSAATLTGYLAVGLGGLLCLLAALTAGWRRWWPVARAVGAFACVLPAAMMGTGAYPWQSAANPHLAVSVVFWVVAVVVTAAALGLARLASIPIAVAAATVAVALFTADAALGGGLQPGSLLNSRPVFGLRWYGFGNVTFAAYATSGLVLAGYLAHRSLQTGRRRPAVVAVALIGFGIVICQGWPSMGSDFGGVIALTPAVLWLALRVSGIRITWLRVVLIGGGTVVAIGLISVLDWLRGPGTRSHLGNFVQRVLDGDALDIVVRKAVASVETMLSPLGFGLLVFGIAVWVAFFRYALDRLEPDWTTLHDTAIAVLLAAVLGTLLNDGGVSVWLTASAMFGFTAASLLLDSLPTFHSSHVDNSE